MILIALISAAYILLRARIASRLLRTVLTMHESLQIEGHMHPSSPPRSPPSLWARTNPTDVHRKDHDHAYAYDAHSIYTPSPGTPETYAVPTALKGPSLLSAEGSTRILRLMSCGVRKRVALPWARCLVCCVIVACSLKNRSS